MTYEYIEAATYWVKIIEKAANLVGESVVSDRDILKYSITLRNGKRIAALSSRPTALRGKGGNLTIDESAFLLDLEETRKAAQALRLWGGQIRYISSHNGKNNPFNLFCQEADINPGLIKKHRTTLKEAIAQGLYRRICLVQGLEWSLQAEIDWEQEIRQQYGIGASEELDCIPSDFRGGGQVFKSEYFNIVQYFNPIKLVRYWDLASTPAEVKSGCYTASVLMGIDAEGKIGVLDTVAFKKGAAEVETAILEQAIADGVLVKIRWEQQPATAGKHLDLSLKAKLRDFDASPSPLMGNKLVRAKASANAAFRGEISLVQGHWNSLLVDNLYAFDGSETPLVADITDAFSGAYNFLVSPVIRRGAIASISY